MSGYALDNSWNQANRRLALLEQLLDPMTMRRLTALGLGPGARCLEVGAGGGSVARWLCAQVGPSGHVVATDINTALLDGLEHPNLETRTHDIMADPLPPAEFDFVHTRWLLHHLPEPERAVRRMVEALKPGGWLLLEEVDFFPVHTSSSGLYRDFMVALTDTVVKASGRDCFWARALPQMVATMGLERVGGEGDFSVIQGGSPVAEFFALTADQMRERMLSSGAMSGERLDEALLLLKSPDFWGFGGGGVAVWGQRSPA
ncbi:methyltransferase domain-containing protein [Bosea sp. 117]|uniref:class I SAM-dependent methyltransferase n=1 Tax=Bosea sp. 117 TaxID=1125973 RepID=UPI00068B607E|nr:methyltransferase domain-containing protein [Bosea sp. 117]